MIVGDTLDHVTAQIRCPVRVAMCVYTAVVIYQVQQHSVFRCRDVAAAIPSRPSTCRFKPALCIEVPGRFAVGHFVR